MKRGYRVEKKEQRRGHSVGGEEQQESGMRSGGLKKRGEMLPGRKKEARERDRHESKGRGTGAGTLLARGISDETWGSGVGAKERNRKQHGSGAEPPAVRPEPEQGQDDGMSDEIVREFLVESSVEPEPAGK